MKLKELYYDDVLFDKYMKLATDWPAGMNGELAESTDGTLVRNTSPLQSAITKATLEVSFDNTHLSVVTAATRIILPYSVKQKMHFADISDILRETNIIDNGSRLQMILDPEKLQRIYQHLNEKIWHNSILWA